MELNDIEIYKLKNISRQIADIKIEPLKYAIENLPKDNEAYVLLQEQFKNKMEEFLKSSFEIIKAGYIDFKFKNGDDAASQLLAAWEAKLWVNEIMK